MSDFVEQFAVPGETATKTWDCESKSSDMTPAMEAKHIAIAQFKSSLKKKKLQILRAARSKTVQAARFCASKYWTQLSEDIQTPYQAALGGCTMASRKHLDQPKARQLPSNCPLERQLWTRASR